MNRPLCIEDPSFEVVVSHERISTGTNGCDECFLKCVSELHQQKIQAKDEGDDKSSLSILLRDTGMEP